MEIFPERIHLSRDSSMCVRATYHRQGKSGCCVKVTKAKKRRASFGHTRTNEARITRGTLVESEEMRPVPLRRVEDVGRETMRSREQCALFTVCVYFLPERKGGAGGK